GLTPATTTALRRDLRLLLLPYDKPIYTDPMLGCSCFRRLRLQRLCCLSTIRIDLAVLAHTMRLCPSTKTRNFHCVRQTHVVGHGGLENSHAGAPRAPGQYGVGCPWRESESDGDLGQSLGGIFLRVYGRPFAYPPGLRCHSDESLRWTSTIASTRDSMALLHATLIPSRPSQSIARLPRRHLIPFSRPFRRLVC
ncbi:hypothetical protein C8F01DRAFT_1143407, partial [Mycena amicta]